MRDVASRSKEAPRMASPARDLRINSSTSTSAVKFTTKMIRSTCPTLAPNRLMDSLGKLTG